MSSADRLSFDDAQILRLESASITGHTCKIAVAERPARGDALGLEALRRHIDSRLGRAPRLRQRLAFPPLRLSGPTWVDDPEFDIDRHVREVETSGTVAADEFRRMAAKLMAERLDHSRPLWRVDLVGPLEGGRAGIVTRIHHCMADGISALRIGGEILWDAEPDSPAADPAGWDPAPSPGAVGLAAAGAADRLSSFGRGVGRVAAAAISPRRWRQSLGSVARMPSALRRELGERVPESPLDRPLGARRELAFAKRPLADLKRIEKAFGERITINDVVLAVVAGGLRDWMRDTEAPLTEMRVKVPVSMHRRDENPDDAGNKDSFMFIDLPLDEPDPVRRLRAINAETLERKQDHDPDALYSFFHGLSHLGPIYRAGKRVSMSPREFSLSISNVPGPREPVYLMGGEVSEIYTIAEPADRHVLRASVVSLAGTMFFGFCTDPDALTDLDLIAGGVERSVDELLARAGSA